MKARRGIICKGVYNISNCDINVTNSGEIWNKIVAGIGCSNGSGLISKVNIDAFASNGMYVQTISCGSDSIMNIDIVSCKLKGRSDGGYVETVRNGKNTTMKIVDTEIIADCSSGKEAMGIGNKGNLTFYSGTVRAPHAGIMNYSGNLSVYGGNLSSSYGGGVYFKGGSGYLGNASLNCIDYEGEFDLSLEKLCSGVWLDGSNSNVTVSLNNCTLSGGKYALVIVGPNSVVNISNSTIGENYEAEKPIRIEESTSKLNIGVGCNFNSDDVKIPDSATITDLVTITNDVYTNPNK